MESKINLEMIYKPSEDVVAREVQGEFIIIPITSGAGGAEDEMFSLNDSGRVIWNKLACHQNLKAMINELSQEYDAPVEEIEKDVVGLMEELLIRKIITK